MLAVPCVAQDGPFAGFDAGAHWVHGGQGNPVMKLLLENVHAQAVTVGGDRTIEGARQAFRFKSLAYVVCCFSSIYETDVVGATARRMGFDGSTL